MINVRIAKTEDIEKISHLLAASWKTAYRGIIDDDYLDSLSYDHWVDFLTTALNGEAIFAMVLCENQEIVGASILGKSEKENEVHVISFYLIPDKIGKGYGHIFYSEIENEIRNRGFTICILNVLENNKRAIRFYESHGFTEANIGTTATLGEQIYNCKVFQKVL